jgi:WD40 repeat protein
MFLSNKYPRAALFILQAIACTLAAVQAAQAGKPELDRISAEGAVKELFRIELSPGKDSLGRGITFYAITPDSKSLAYCDLDYREAGKTGHGELVLIDLTSGKELHRARTEGSCRDGMFSPDGKLLAVGTPGSKTAVAVWDVATWKPKVQLKRPDDHDFGTPLAFSPDGKLVAGRAQRKKPSPSFTEDLVLWEMATGACRVLEDDGAKRFSWKSNLDGSVHIMVLEGKDGAVKWPPAPLGTIIVGRTPVAASFPDTGSSDRLFVEYPYFVTVWDTARGKALATELPLGSFQFRFSGMTGGLIIPSERMEDYYRFRTALNGRTLVLPRYDPPPIIAYGAPDVVRGDGWHHDGAIVLAATPIEKTWGLRKPSGGFPFAELCRLTDYKSATAGPSLALSPDGRRLVALGIDPKTEKSKTPTYVLRVWDVSALHPIAAKKVQKLTGAEREKLWANLFEDLVDSSKTQGLQFNLQFQAMFSLVLHGDDAVAWLRKKMGPLSDLKKIPQLILDLDSDDFDTRERASRDLERQGQLARPFLARALAKGPSAETKRRAEALLDKLKDTAAAYELRQMRIIDVLEHINTAAARELLQAIADGKYDPSFAEEAKQAWRRATGKR